MNSKGDKASRQDVNSYAPLALNPWVNNAASTSSAKAGFIDSIDFNRVEYDPTAVTSASPVVVSATLKLNSDIDQQTTITANGVLVRRARDSFARGVAAGGTGGLLESNTLADNTWIPISSASTLYLDGTTFANQFPEIIMASPSSTRNLNSVIASAKPCPTVIVSGQTVDDSGPCLDQIPSLSYPKPTIRSLSVVRVLQGTYGQDDTKPRVMFADLGVPGGQVQANASTTTDIRVVSNTTQTIWSPLTEVYQIDKSQNVVARLNCAVSQATGSQLICDLPAKLGSTSHTETDPASFEVIDVDHILDATGSVGPIKGWANLNRCHDTSGLDTCKNPTFLSINGPTPTADDSAWQLTVDFVNVNTSNQYEPNKATLAGISASSVNSNGEDHPLEIIFKITPDQIGLLQNSATLTLLHDVSIVQTVQLKNLLVNLRPTASTIASDSMSWNGTNLLGAYAAIKVGDGGVSHPIKCNSDTFCQVSPSEDLTKEPKAGFVYLVTASSVAVPLMSTAGGSLSIVTYTPPPPKAANAGPSPQATTQSQTSTGNAGGAQSLTVQTPIIATQNVKPATSE